MQNQETDFEMNSLSNFQMDFEKSNKDYLPNKRIKDHLNKECKRLKITKNKSSIDKNLVLNPDLIKVQTNDTAITLTQHKQQLRPQFSPF